MASPRLVFGALLVRGTPVKRLAILVCAVLLSLSVVAAGEPLRVSLDFFPNPSHVPLYVAMASGRFAEAGLEIELIVPANPSDPVKLAAARTIDVALTPQINYLIARAEGLPLIAIGALIDKPLGGLLALADRGVEELEDLRGGRIGYSLAPLEPILWETMLASVGISVDEVELINVGFNTMVSLLAGSVDAIGGFRNFEPIQVRQQGREPAYFPQEDYGVPWTYEILMAVHPTIGEERGEDLQRFLSVLADAVSFTLEHPEEALGLFLEANPDLDDELNRLSYEASLPLYAMGLRHDDAVVWDTMQAYLGEHELIDLEALAGPMFTADLLPPGE